MKLKWLVAGCIIVLGFFIWQINWMPEVFPSKILRISSHASGLGLMWIGLLLLSIFLHRNCFKVFLITSLSVGVITGSFAFHYTVSHPYPENPVAALAFVTLLGATYSGLWYGALSILVYQVFRWIRAQKCRRKEMEYDLPRADNAAEPR